MSTEAIEGLKPELLWQRFHQIAQIPRGSKNEKRVVEFLKDTAASLGLQYKTDHVGNVVVLVPASPGYEKCETVVLQAHIDMVCEKNKATEHNFETDPIKLKREGEFVTADGTTLGADNGIGASAMLAVMTDNSFVHGPVECLFTIDEETGLTGVNNLQPGFVTGRTLLNTDSEEDGAFYVGCAGGQDTAGVLNIKYDDAEGGYKYYRLAVGGLQGGHSGMDINLRRGNAIKMLARTLAALRKADILICSIEGGSKRNAIPREAEAVIAVKADKTDAAASIVSEMESVLREEYKTTESALRVTLTADQVKDNKTPADNIRTFTGGFASLIVDVLLALPHGTIAMSPDIEGLVETSTNLATVVMNGEKITIGTSQRSSVESSKKYIASSVAAVFRLAGAEVMVTDGYPGWKPDMNSRVLKIAKDVYVKNYGTEPDVKAIHAGLECGILGDKYPGMDMMSFGPSIFGAHTPDEKVEIKTVEKFYSLLKSILTELTK